MFEIQGFSGSKIHVGSDVFEREILYSPHADFKITALSREGARINVKLEEVRAHKGSRVSMPY